ncbi:DUF4124 domain-containing protein [Chitinimonas sp. PSY-7]|uniref:DUF4124 domain-containing protein n=1 Tax=Chitinimonas sp. PSY-7 TaxID=3459088 RepID=UPI0040400AD3
MRTHLPLLALLICLPASAAIYKWVDENGKIQYSDKPPHQQTTQGTTKLNSRGMVVDKSEGLLTPEQKAAKEKELAKQREAAQKEMEARRRDKALLNSFTSTSEIDALLARNVEQLQASIQSDKGRIEAAQKRLDTVLARANKITTSNKPIPEDLRNSIQERQADLTKLNEDIKQKEANIAQLRQRAEDDKKRFTELRGPSSK